MPRLSNKDYWKYHKTLRHLWLNHSSIYGYLSPKQQWELHAFFQPYKDLTKEQLIEYRRLVTEVRPGLSHQAGWAMKAMQQVLDTPAQERRGGTRYRDGNKIITVKGIVRPEIDIEKIARALTMMEERKAREK
jgi:hypothetical protein